MKNLYFWRRLSNIAIYLCGFLLVVDTFFFNGTGFYSFLTIIEITALCLLLISELMKFYLKRKHGES
jgi:hypothetical protein